MKHKNAQVSTEYIIIVGFVVVIVIPLLIIFYNFSGETKDEITTNQLSKISRKVVDEAESMHYLGENSKTTIKVYMPTNVKGAKIQSNEVYFNVSTSKGFIDIEFPSPVNISGSIPNTSGVHMIKVESKGDYVWIGT